MITIGERFPDFNLKGVTSNDMKGFKAFTNASAKGKWSVFFFWPKDFTFVCPTEIEGFAALTSEFEAADTQVYGLSTDSEFVHLAWRQTHSGLQNLPFPMLSDIRRELSQALGILHKDEGVCLRATYIVDPEGIIRHISINDLNVGRSPEEILRLVKAFQQGGLMPCSWKPGQRPLQVA